MHEVKHMIAAPTVVAIKKFASIPTYYTTLFCALIRCSMCVPRKPTLASLHTFKRKSHCQNITWCIGLTLAVSRLCHSTEKTQELTGAITSMQYIFVLHSIKSLCWAIYERRIFTKLFTSLKKKAIFICKLFGAEHQIRCGLSRKFLGCYVLRIFCWSFKGCWLDCLAPTNEVI